MFTVSISNPFGDISTKTTFVRCVSKPTSNFKLANVSFAGLIQVNSVQFSSVQGGIYALGKAHMRSTPSLRCFPNVALEPVPMFV